MNEVPKRPEGAKVSVVTSTKETGADPDSYQVPRVAISEKKDSILLQLEMPGVGPGGVELSIDKDRLTVIGRREEEINTLDPVYRTRNPLHYRRLFSLGRGVDLDGITATLENDGMLLITLPKMTSESGKSVVVRAI
ncbi:MAG TPA: Hsp20/alpha crystallin family protein [bacterium]|nr:Hsp20/alpha crystallin family protein [bacterium]HPO08139.1 Hsp20/alpha crystallin family protein [bacterium]HQO35225.1 Hsp20/alpha crystallin family protein [bacterium]HQP98330.1 Hsp20/alpha crystallin family protein [bacterium]